jgi:hypothetical protein
VFLTAHAGRQINPSVADMASPTREYFESPLSDVIVEKRSRRRGWLAAACVAAILLVGFWPSFDSIALPMDEGMVLVYPELISHGQIPYRDFETFYGPANLYVLAGCYRLFETNIFTERAIGLVYRSIAILSIFGIARRWGTAGATGAMLVGGGLLICTQLIAFAWIGGLAAALGALWILSSEVRSGRYFGAGLLAGLALLFRPDIGLAIGASALPFLWVAGWRQRAEYAAGFGIMLGLLAALAVEAGLMNVWNNLFFYPVVMSNPGRHFPLGSVQPYLLKLLVLHIVASLTIAGAGLLALRKNPGCGKGLVLLSVAGFALTLTPQAAQRLDFGHFVFAGLVSFSFLPIALADLLKKLPWPVNRSFAPIAAVVFTICVVETVAPELTTDIRAAFAAGFRTKGEAVVFVEQQGRSFPFHSQSVARYAGRLFEKLDQLSTPGQRLFVGPADLRRTNYSDTYIYHLCPKLRPATYFLEMNPFSANRPDSRLAGDIASADWVVLNKAWDNWREPNRCVENGSDAPNRVVETGFTRIAEYGPYLLFQRKTVAGP